MSRKMSTKEVRGGKKKEDRGVSAKRRRPPSGVASLRASHPSAARSGSRASAQGWHLRVGDVIRVLDLDFCNEIAVCVESDGHTEYPYCCMLMSNTKHEREEFWPTEYVRLGNVNEWVLALGMRSGAAGSPPKATERKRAAKQPGRSAAKATPKTRKKKR